jgi:hypothetical protein
MDGTEPLLRPPETTCGRRPSPNSSSSEPRQLTQFDCLELLLLAFRDLADRDDIHQADQRLKLVRRWLRAEAARAAADPIFTEPAAVARRLGVTAVRRRQPASSYQSSHDEWPIP